MNQKESAPTTADEGTTTDTDITSVDAETSTSSKGSGLGAALSDEHLAELRASGISDEAVSYTHLTLPTTPYV